MTELEAAEKLASLLNEIQAAGHPVAINSNAAEGACILEVGDTHSVLEPQLDDGEWLVIL